MLPSNSITSEISRLTHDALQVFRRDCQKALSLASQAIVLARSLGREPELRAPLGHALRVRAMSYGMVGKIEEAKTDFAEALLLARDTEEVELEAQCLHGLSVANFHLGDCATALELMAEAVALRRVINNPVGLQISLNSLAAFYGSQGNYSEAIACLTEAHDLAKSDPNSTDVAIILTNLALVHVEIGQPEDALPLFEESFLLYDRLPDASGRCNTLLNYANTLQALGRTEEALVAARAALALAQQLGHPAFEVKTLATLGSVMPSPEQAEPLLQNALQLAQERELSEPLAVAQKALGIFYLDQGKADKASHLLEEALASAKKDHRLYIQSELHKALCRTCEALGDLPRALHHHREFHTLFAQRHQESANHRLRNQRFQYETAQARLEAEELRRQALEDPLTQLYNRRYLSQYLESEILRSRRHNVPLSLILIDIDNFKAVNDNFSHQMGDKVLVTLAQLLQQASRGSDIVVRQAGDEFVVVTPETSLYEAHLMAERLQQAIQHFDWNTLAPGLNVTISSGVADLLSDDNLLNRADERLYEAKRAGKNRLSSQEPVSAGNTTEKLNC